MSLYAQHGYGKSNKIDRGIQGRHLAGVILSPKDERPDKMGEYINYLQTNYPSIDILFDPQFYVTTVIPANEGNLIRYDYYESSLTRRNFVAPSDLARYVERTIDYQMGLNLTNIVSPSILLDNFNDPWSQIALSLAHESQAYHSRFNNGSSLLISLCFSEMALRNSDALNEFLDMISLLDVHGFYIIIKRDNNNGSPQIEPIILQNLMYLSYVLSYINQYTVVLGYTDFVGVPLYATGISAISCGWYNGLREFSLSRFQPSTGGRRPRARYSSQQLLNSILIIPELDTINRLGMINSVLSNTNYDGVIRPNPANTVWPLDLSCLHHWQILNRIISGIDNMASVSEKLDYVVGLIDQADITYSTFVNANIIFDNKSNREHLRQWRIGIDGFRNQLGV
ncbi:MAG: hypothetical protein A4E53_02689 [Pelotomaculum sp. PtaB.Bin104]|nr:MAG: hypothetical protein A4E53_02689 [Pelotomaculum sp. PtaB.Bin104]